MLRDKWKHGTEVFTAGISFAVCAVLAKGGLELVSVEREGGRALALGVPVWLTQTILPIGFAVIGLRILWKVPSRWGRAAAAAFIFFPILMGMWEDLPGSGILVPVLAVLILATALGALSGLSGGRSDTNS